MARFGRMEVFVTDSAGNALNGVSVEFRRAGALTNGATGPTTIVANTVGSILVGDTVRAGLAGASDAVASIVSEVSFTASGAGWGALADGVLMSITAPFPAVFNAEDGTEALTQPGLQTDADGFLEAYAENGMYDIFITGGGATTEIRHNVPCVGGTETKIYIVGSGTTEHWIWDTGRVLAAGDKHTVWKDDGTEIASLTDAGKLTLVGVGGLTTGGAIVNTAGGLTIIGNSTITGTLGGVTNLTLAGTLTGVTTGTFSNDIQVRRLRANQGTTLVPGDITLGSGWGTGPSAPAPAGTDTAGTVVITTGTTPSGDADFTLTFTDGAYSVAPVVVVTRSNGTINGAIGVPVNMVLSTTFVKVTVVGPLAASTSYRWNWHVIERP